MMFRKINPIGAIAVAGLLALVAIGLYAYDGQRVISVRYYPQTGHLIREPFLSYVEAHGGVEMFGYPLTDAYTSESGVLLQTFERVQLQLTVRGVELALLGQRLSLGKEGERFDVAPEFEAFYDRAGGERFFGPALGVARDEAGILLQDFASVRIMQDSTGRIRLADLGKAYLAVSPAPASDGLIAFRIRGTPQPPLVFRASVSVANPSVGQGDQQTIYLYVEDQNGNSVEGAESLALLKYNNASGEIAFNPTDHKGLASAHFIVPPAPPGSRVVIEMHVLVGETVLTVETSYIQWW